MPTTPENDLINDQSAGIERLLEIMRRLRDPDTGCPWDIEQDFDTIAPYTIEEAYEVADAIERRDWHELEGELGDLLLQSVYHTAMGEEQGLFSFQSKPVLNSNFSSYSYSKKFAITICSEGFPITSIP